MLGKKLHWGKKKKKLKTKRKNNLGYISFLGPHSQHMEVPRLGVV